MVPFDSDHRDPGLAARLARTGREPVLEAAYGPFSRSGTRAVGDHTTVAQAGVAKMTLYRNYQSKVDLALAYAKLREERWGKGWLQADVRERAHTPADRLLAIFDAFGEWFGRDDAGGCAFVTIMLECVAQSDPVRQASVCRLAYIREFLAELALGCDIDDPEAFAHQWDTLMKGAIIAAAEGDCDAACRAQDLGKLLLAHHGVEHSG